MQNQLMRKKRWWHLNFTCQFDQLINNVSIFKRVLNVNKTSLCRIQLNHRKKKYKRGDVMAYKTVGEHICTVYVQLFKEVYANFHKCYDIVIPHDGGAHMGV